MIRSFFTLTVYQLASIAVSCRQGRKSRERMCCVYSSYKLACESLWSFHFAFSLSIQFQAARKMTAISVSIPFLFVLFSHFLSSYAGMEKERTLAIVKPDGVSGNYTEQIKSIIRESGFIIVREKMLQLNEETVSLFYAEHSERSFFPDLVTYMTSGPVYVMVLEKLNAISDWRNLIGPTDAKKAKISHPNSIRALCGADSERNCVHGSDSPQSAAREISFFFRELSAGGATHDEL